VNLNARQIDVLQWIGDGLPERDWPDWTHRTTAKALHSRSLVKVRGSGKTWTAEITDLGRRVLSGEEQAPARGRRGKAKTAPETSRASASKSGTRSATDWVEVDPEDLVADLVSAEGQMLTIPDPGSALRAGYRRALAAVSDDIVPTGKRVTYSGRNHGDLTIRLVDAGSAVEPDPEVKVPDELDPEHPLVAWLVQHPKLVDVSDESRDRALRVVQGLADALSSRGHVVAKHRVPKPEEDASSHDRRTGWGSRRTSPPPPEPATFEVRIRDQVLLVDLVEERDKVKKVADDVAAAAKYEWQRFRPVEAMEFSGRLALRVRGFTAVHGWADRKRWTLESRLPRLVRNLEEEAQRRAEAFDRATDAKRKLRREWEEALPKARARYLASLNRERLDKQLAAHAKAQERLAYADAVEARAKDLDPDDRAAAEAWADWIRTEAQRIAPTEAVGELRFHEPTDVRPWDLNKFMPGLLSASDPPEDPDATNASS
jgi:hypothetical protein